METTKCPDCGYDVPRSQSACPECGCPIEHATEQPTEQPAESQVAVKKPACNTQAYHDSTNHKATTDWDGSGYSLWRLDVGQYLYESFMIVKHTFFNKFFCFSGRATRREFWSFYFLGLAIPLAFILIYPLFLLMLFAILFPYLGVTIRRLHDNGHSGWWIFAPPICLFYCLQQNNPNINEYGLPSSDENLF